MDPESTTGWRSEGRDQEGRENGSKGGKVKGTEAQGEGGRGGAMARERKAGTVGGRKEWSLRWSDDAEESLISFPEDIGDASPVFEGIDGCRYEWVE